LICQKIYPKLSNSGNTWLERESRNNVAFENMSRKQFEQMLREISHTNVNLIYNIRPRHCSSCFLSPLISQLFGRIRYKRRGGAVEGGCILFNLRFSVTEKLIVGSQAKHHVLKCSEIAQNAAAGLFSIFPFPDLKVFLQILAYSNIIYYYHLCGRVEAVI